MKQPEKDSTGGVFAIFAGACWIAWAIANGVTHRGLENAAPGTFAAAANSFLTAGWNLLLIPGALRLYANYRGVHPRLLLAATIAGILSLTLWAIGGLTHISYLLETTYLVLASFWLLVLGFTAIKNTRAFGYFTLAVAGFTSLDALFNLIGPVPFAVYVFAAPKLPLSAVWSLVVGIVLIQNSRSEAGGSVSA